MYSLLRSCCARSQSCANCPPRSWISERRFDPFCIADTAMWGSVIKAGFSLSAVRGTAKNPCSMLDRRSPFVPPQAHQLMPVSLRHHVHFVSKRMSARPIAPLRRRFPRRDIMIPRFLSIDLLRETAIDEQTRAPRRIVIVTRRRLPTSPRHHRRPGAARNVEHSA